MLVISSFLLISCSGKQTIRKELPELTGKPILSYAKRLRIENMEGYSQITIINPWQGADNIVQKWYFLSDEGKKPVGVDSSSIIKVPVKSIICTSTTHLAMIISINEAMTISGFSGTRFIYSNDLLSKVSEGEIPDIGYEDNLNKELLLKINPDVVMVYGIGGESIGYISKLRELGVKVLYNADYLETDPLGKAEWIKMIGALYSKQRLADSLFSATEKEYNMLKEFIGREIKTRPKVMLGMPFKDTWFVSPGNSYISKLIYDAGGEYIWKDVESSVSMPLGLEDVFIKAMMADYWLNTGTAVNLSEVIAVDPRLADLECFKRGNLYNNNKRINSAGGNDYWEGGTVQPQMILKDIAAILHPELFGNTELYYYKRLK